MVVNRIFVNPLYANLLIYCYYDYSDVKIIIFILGRSIFIPSRDCLDLKNFMDFLTMPVDLECVFIKGWK